MTSIDRSHLTNEAHRLARIHTMLHQVETYIEGLSKGLKQAWSTAKAKAAAAAKRMQKPTHVWAYQLDGVKVAETSRAVAFECKFDDGSLEVVWFPRRAVRDQCKALVSGWFLDTVKEPELIEAFPDKRIVAPQHTSESFGITANNGTIILGGAFRKTRTGYSGQFARY